MFEAIIALTLGSLGFAISELYYIRAYRRSPDEFKDTLDSIPGAFPLAGLLCTIIFIALGLYGFDSSNIQSGIPDIINKIKYAFWGSGVGVLGGFIYHIRIAALKDKVENSLRSTEKINSDLESLIKRSINDTIGIYVDGFYSSIDSIAEKRIQTGLDSISELLKLNNKKIDDLSVQLEMSNEGVISRFDNFGEILRNSNTDALMDVMQDTTSKFNDQMKGLVDSLVEKNFKELGNNIQQLNNWQQQNKEQMERMLFQYQAFVQGIENVADNISRIENYVVGLTGADGKLELISNNLTDLAGDNGLLINLGDRFEYSTNAIKMQSEVNFKLTEQIIKMQKAYEGNQNVVVALQELVKSLADFDSEIWVKYRQELNNMAKLTLGMIRNLEESALRIDKSTSEAHDRNRAEFRNYLEKTFQNLDRLMRQIAEHYINDNPQSNGKK